MLEDAIAGTDLYYAALYFPKNIRPILSALEIIRREVTSIPFEISDPSVSNLKLSWWWDEVARLKAKASRHPATALLAEHDPSPGAVSKKLHDLIENAQTLVHQAPAIGVDALLENIRIINEPVFHHLLKTCDKEVGDNSELVLRFAYTSELVNHLLSPRFKSHASLTKPRSTSAVLDSASQLNIPTNAESQSNDLRKNLMISVLEELASTLSACPNTLHRKQRFFSTLARINQSVLKRTIANKAPRSNRVELLPITKLWISWRTNFLF